MNNKNKKIATALALSLVAAMSFRDTGMLIKDFSNSNDSLNSGEKIEIIQETDRVYLVQGKAGNVEIPKDNMIKEIKSEFTYKVKNVTDIVNENSNESQRKLRKNEVIEAVYLDGNQGVFKTQDGITGTVSLDQLEVVGDYTETKGVSKVDTVLKSGENTFTIKRGNPVKVIGYKGDDYVVIDMQGNRYNTAKSNISIGNENEAAAPTRGGLDIAKKPSNKVDNLVANAKKEIGKPYVSGDTGSRGYDCSGFTYAMYLKTFNMKLPRTSGGQSSAGQFVDKSKLQAGDLVFFRTTGKGIGHVGIYIGNGNMIHASTGQRRITTTSIHTNYFASRYVTARRVIN